MQVYSMTGYASVHSSSGVGYLQNENALDSSVQIGIELRSVNSRFLDIGFRLPDELRNLEPNLRELLQTRLKRGKVEFRISLENTEINSVQQPSTALLQRLNSLEDSIKTWLPQAASLGIGDILKIASHENQPHKKPLDIRVTVLQLAKLAINELMLARDREGSQLATTLLMRTEQLRILAAVAEPLVPQLMALQQDRFKERFRDAMQMDAESLMPDSVRERAMNEATAYAIRIDISEEVTRLQAHLIEINRLLKSGGEVGKRLDFLVQELHREANTLGSKSASLQMTQISIDMKVLIEQIREQVQNLE